MKELTSLFVYIPEIKQKDIHFTPVIKSTCGLKPSIAKEMRPFSSDHKCDV